jgi:uncharacterized Zn-binding protein involved in type VI secretion/triacylglycerol esterase/lipase EstA (alpha/beta hydrolase family)
MHVCPMVTVLVPHVGGPIMPPGVPTVLIGGQPAATVTGMCTCVGPPDIIIMGSTGVLINYLPAARMGDPTAHGGSIILGCPTVMIGEVGSPSPGAAGAAAVSSGLAATGHDNPINANKSVYAFGAKIVDGLAGTVAELAGKFLAGKKAVRAWMLNHSSIDTTQSAFDGKVIGAGCKPTDPDTVSTAPGVRPTSCRPGATIPKVYFANGINTKAYGQDATMCASMQKIADRTCAEVVGIYGATQGMLPDLDQSVDEIEKTSNSPQVKTLSALITDAVTAQPPQPLNIIAHSRGGLATQQAISDAKKTLLLEGDATEAEVDQSLSAVSVTAYGTAEQGWPVGPTYSKLNNLADPVPKAMKGAQQNFPDATFADNDATPTFTFDEPKYNPVDAHSLDSVYSKYMVQASGPRDCDCS